MKTKPKHRKPGFPDRKPENRRTTKQRFGDARHRMEGPELAPTIYDITPAEFWGIKGAGGRT
jgi:hypothetical protein